MTDNKETATAPAFTYSVKIEDGTSLDVADNFKVRPTVTAVVLRSDGVVVWRGAQWWTGKDMRGQRLKASNEARQFKRYFDQHRKCWFDVRKAELAATKAERAAAQKRRAQVASKSMELLAALRDAVGVVGLPIAPADAMKFREEWHALIELADPSTTNTKGG
jgi:hypothetical protein